jgi:SAM-dependent methyltransferase
VRAQPGREVTSQRVQMPKFSAAAKPPQGDTTVPVHMSYSAPSVAVPKTARQASSRLPKLDVSGTTRTPPLISPSFASTADPSQSNDLRRKPSSIGNTSRRQGAGSMSLSRKDVQPMAGLSGNFRDPFSETVLGISLPPSSSILARSDAYLAVSEDRFYDYMADPAEILQLPTPQYTLSTTPSTRYSDSPGPFSVSSTPTSMSSYSPGVTISKHVGRVRQASPLQSRPPVVPTKRLVQAPPELAHLADSPLTSIPEPHRPRRPSRDGTLEISGLRGPSPIIQSNMTSIPSLHKRTSSAESKASGRARFGIPSKTSSRNPSPNLGLQSGSAPISRVPTRGQTPDIPRNHDEKHSKASFSPTSAVVQPAAKSSRFGFFRRNKTEPVPEPVKAEKKLQRRGPVAGTGHEGYGRYAIRGRSGSSIGGGSIGRSASAGTTTESLGRTPSSRKSSMTSTTSSEMDDFFSERLAPVVIRGTGSSIERSRNQQPMQSDSSLDLISPSEDDLSKTLSSSSISAVEKTRPTLLPSAMSDPIRGDSPSKKRPSRFRRPTESDDDSKHSFLSSLASKRTSRTAQLPEESKASSSSAATGTRQAGVDYTSHGREGKWLGSKTDKATKSQANAKHQTKPSKKWNFFQRAHATPRSETPAIDDIAAASRAPPSRSVAHYALIDNHSDVDLEDIEQLMQEADSTPEEPEPIPEQFQEPTKEAVRDQKAEPKERLHSMLLPPKPVLPYTATPTRPGSPKVFLRPEIASQSPQHRLVIDTNVSSASVAPTQAELTPVTDLSPPSSPFRSFFPVDDIRLAQDAPSTALPTHSLSPPGPPSTSLPPRPSRLPQVGRIPQVVSQRYQKRQPPSQSFSRPFATKLPYPSVLPRRSFESAASLSVAAGLVEPYPILQGLDALSHRSAIATISPGAEESNRQSEFFKFPPRKDSEVSYSSSSGTWSFPATSDTAVIPGPGVPQLEDEIWKEYDDLLDEVLSPITTSGDGLQRPLSRRHPSLEPLPLNTKNTRTSVQSISSYPSIHLRRSRLLAVLHSAQSPTSSVSLSDFLQDHGDKNLSVVDPVTGRLSFPLSTRVSTGPDPRNRSSSTRTSLPASLTLSARQSRATLGSSSDKDRDSASINRYRDTRLMEIAEAQSDGLESMANLRFGALMTSKWLSFGRVLFSPAHFELKKPDEDRVLVIDGLGRDWSYYCALTYPEATVYNLGPGASSSTSSDGNVNEPWSQLNNHCHVSHASLASAFPFPRGFFACVVLRFPTALPSAVHRLILSECKRVLRPGGHLEFSVLDLDLVNMGNRARRAVRGLKVKMQVVDEHISLRNISDEIMAGLGKKGFTECNRCFVGVPVAGRLPDPIEVESPEVRKRKGSIASSTGKSSLAAKSVKTTKADTSWTDLLTSQSTEPTDDGIADMVARVGRWWYSRCYESLVLPEAGEPGAATSSNIFESSIWKDENLIKECEKRGTSFRLLIGYAQKPEVGVRRTVSV